MTAKPKTGKTGSAATRAGPGAAARVAWAYDPAGRMTNEALSVGSWTFGVGRSLDPSGLPTNTTLSVGSWALNVRRSFDLAGRPVSQAAAAGAFANAYCGWNGLVSAVSNSALTAEFGCDIMDRVTNTVYRNASGTVVGAFSYRRDALGLVTQKVSFVGASASTNAYAYDALGRLVSERLLASNALSSSFAYDLSGNRLSVVTSTNQQPSATNLAAYTHNRLGGASYDAAGNVTGMVARSGVRLSLSWNTQGQLVSVSTNGAFAESYVYDALGRRVSTTSLSTTNHQPSTVFHAYDGDRCIADVAADGKPLCVYTWGPGTDNLLAVTHYIPGGGTNTYYAVKDHLGSVCLLVDSAGLTKEACRYGAWGETLIMNATRQPLAASAYGNRFMFHGGAYSAATGLCQFRARWYSPELGRWLSPDPIGLEGGLNLYEFCRNDPVNGRDPSGLVTVFVYDGNDSTLWRVLQATSARYTFSYDMGRDKDLSGLKTYLESLKQRGIPINTLIIADHGGSEVGESRHKQQYNDHELTNHPNSECDMKEIGTLMHPYFSEIILLGCHVGDNLEYLKSLANSFGHPVGAYDALIYWGDDGTYYPGVPYGEGSIHIPFTYNKVRPN